MIKSKLHNPVIANNSHIENAVVQKVDNTAEAVFSDLGNIVPVVPETGRIWFNTEKGQFSFANIGLGGNGENYVDEFLSRTDLRAQTIASKVDFNDTIKVNATDTSTILTVDSATKDVTVVGANLNTTLSGTSTTSVTGNVVETCSAGKTEGVTLNSSRTVGGTDTTNVTGAVSQTYSNTLTLNVTGDVTENFSASQQTNITSNLGIKIGGTATVTDGSDNVKIDANNVINSLTVNYATVNFNGQTETHTLSDKLVINNGVSDKFIIDNTNDKVTIVYGTVETTSTDVSTDVSNTFILKDGVTDRITADHTNDTLDIVYNETTITGNATVDGNMVVTGDLTVGGQTTKVDVASEQMTIADNVVVLNSNLTTEDPRLASALVEGEDVDADAGLAVNRGSEGILELIKWVESSDTSSAETLKEATANVSIWNYEAATPAYELHQIIEAYTLGRQVDGVSGASWVGYDGHEGTNYTAAIGGGATEAEALDYSFKLDAGKLDNTLDSIVQEIDDLKFGSQNTVRVGETPSAGTSFTITHNLGTVFVDVVTQRVEGGNWYFDLLPVQVVDENTVLIEATESTRIRYMISAVEGFDVNQATELVIT